MTDKEIVKRVDSLKHECEELKNNLHIANTNHEAAKQERDRYLKALEEIEEYCDKQISLTGDLPFRITESDILDIINKAKGTDNGLS